MKTKSNVCGNYIFLQKFPLTMLRKLSGAVILLLSFIMKGFFIRCVSAFKVMATCNKFVVLFYLILFIVNVYYCLETNNKTGLRRQSYLRENICSITHYVTNLFVTCLLRLHSMLGLIIGFFHCEIQYLITLVWTMFKWKFTTKTNFYSSDKFNALSIGFMRKG